LFGANLKDRFIESLLLGYPIPGIILVQQQDRRYLVLDGQQRLRTLAAFYDGLHAGKEFSLQNVAEEYKGSPTRSSILKGGVNWTIHSSRRRS
jgi:hypothetical protein